MRGRAGKTDRMVRVLTGVVALAVGSTQAASIGSDWAFIADVVGVIGLGTGVFGRCPLYAMFGVQTCQKSP